MTQSRHLAHQASVQCFGLESSLVAHLHHNLHMGVFEMVSQLSLEAGPMLASSCSVLWSEIVSCSTPSPSGLERDPARRVWMCSGWQIRVAPRAAGRSVVATGCCCDGGLQSMVKRNKQQALVL